MTKLAIPTILLSIVLCIAITKAQIPNAPCNQIANCASCVNPNLCDSCNQGFFPIADRTQCQGKELLI